MKKQYSAQSIEKKWQQKWDQQDVFRQYDRPEKYYVLDMFPYPSGAGLHVGHPKGYIASDVVARTKQLQGFGVLHPMGWDAFGLPAEQFAIKNKVSPRVAMDKNIAYFKEQLQAIGFTFDWQREINTTDPAYYKWTQWIFLQLFKKGLAYESFEPINWCPSCQTGLSNEDLEQGKCERCGSVVEKKPMRQWMLRITDYADRLLNDLNETSLDWEESIKDQQRHWIGRSEGMLFSALVKDTDIKIQTFSAHFEAFMADTFIVIAPDHALLPQLLEGVENADEIQDFCKKILDQRRATAYGTDTAIEGMFTGRYVLDPCGNGELPIWIASYALSDYGTGIIKCSAHDERDFAFAKKYNIPLKAVLFPEDEVARKKVEQFEICYSDMQHGTLTEPQELSGNITDATRQSIVAFLEEKQWAQKKVQYRLRDWVFSRQRYWGEPIPLIHCSTCGVVPVPEQDLPLILPEVEFYEPTGNGESPLASIDEWVNTSCPQCDGPAKRETNTMPQWAGSCWYYLRYIDSKNDAHFIDATLEKQWMSVDLYVGGMEHITRHILYARFWHKVLFDLGFVSTNEPFTKFMNVGLIMAEDGRKMSKRWGNVVNPDDVIAQFGADTFRVYEMFMGPFSQSIDWNSNNLVGPRRFLEKIWRMADKVMSSDASTTQEVSPELRTLFHTTIQKVTDDIASFRFNTAISSLMILANEMDKPSSINGENFEILLVLLSPFAPHVTEELWEMLGHTESLFLGEWPKHNEAYLQSASMDIVIQVNGKTRTVIMVSSDSDQKTIETMAMKDEKIAREIAEKTIRKVIYVPSRLINIVL